jgi:hypothetical protein
VEHAHSVDRPFAWRGVALAVALFGVIGLAGLGGMALIHSLGRTRPVSDTGHVQKSHVAHPAVTLHPRSDISVLVLNANGINGAAGGLATRLLGRGYRHAVPLNAQSHVYAHSFVLFRRGYAGEAQRLGKDANIRAIAPLDGHLPAADSHYQLILILGG